MKKSIVTFALLVGFVASSFAHVLPIHKEPAALSADELALLEKLNAEELNLDDFLAETELGDIQRVLVYDAQGNLLLTQETEIDLDALPTGASLLMTDGDTQYYIVL